MYVSQYPGPYDFEAQQSVKKGLYFYSLIMQTDHEINYDIVIILVKSDSLQ